MNSKGSFDAALFFATCVGLALVMASACVWNNYIDRDLDKKMSRTQNRPLVLGLIKERSAILFALFLGILGAAILHLATNKISLLIAAAGFFIYVVIYSLWKCRTLYATAIGSLAGAVPPLVGYTAVSQKLDLGAFLFFAIMVLWQMPHFFAIALSRLDDYTRAGIPVLPIKKGIFRTKIHILLYILGFIFATSLLTAFNYTGSLFLIAAGVSGLIWLWLALKGFQSDDVQLWGRQMFLASLWVITAVCLSIILFR
jgi:protoheme IX farnesyltransferase